MQRDQNREKTMKDRGVMSQHRLFSPTKPLITLISHTIKAGKAWKTREMGETDLIMAVSSALRREYNSHSMGSKIVQQIDAANKSPHNYDAAAHAAMLHGNFFADLSVRHMN
ncbi:MAG: hypothetical protein C0392_07650 [Syntrophus sp. (in: bacteria)]|nr:hypothetical protein [Syntrophus sp. (in: bacteria)]